MYNRRYRKGDRVKLTSPYGPGDPNEGVEGIVVGYDEDDDLVVDLCDEFTWSRESVRTVDHLIDTWWTLIPPRECCCSSLL